MGQDKALIPIQGVPLLQRTCTIAQDCTPTVYVITPWPERYRSLLTCMLIQEQSERSHGPLVGFAQGLAQVAVMQPVEWVLLLACDLPRLQSSLLHGWMQQLDGITETALLAKSGKGWEPLCGFYRASCLTRLQTAIAGGERSFQGWLAQESVCEAAIDDSTLLFNCNTPDDLSQV